MIQAVPRLSSEADVDGKLIDGKLIDGKLIDGKLIMEFRPGRVIRWVALLATVVLLIPGLGMFVIGITLVFLGKVDLLSLFTLLPTTLLAGAFVYSACYLWVYRIVVYRESLVVRTIHGTKQWHFVDLLDVRFETTTARSETSDGIAERVALFMMSKDPQLPPHRIRVFLNNRPVLERAIQAWHSAIILAGNPSRKD